MELTREQVEELRRIVSKARARSYPNSAHVSCIDDLESMIETDAALRTRLEKAEQDIHYLEHRPDAPEKEIQALHTRLEAVEREREIASKDCAPGTDTSYTGQIATLKQRLATAQARIDKLENVLHNNTQLFYAVTSRLGIVNVEHIVPTLDVLAACVKNIEQERDTWQRTVASMSAKAMSLVPGCRDVDEAWCKLEGMREQCAEARAQAPIALPPTPRVN